ncbi:MAG: MATE family efflux transporter [Lachnospiraceae bacterium]|nr:MATE family efflux transporter [Lachnospiraceae bacterium]
MEQTYMKEKPILQLVLSMSLPMVISMTVNSLYNIVDSLFVARISENAMTALSLVFPVQNLVNSVAVGFAIGINAMIAFFLGAQEQKKADWTASAGVLLSILHGALMMAVCIFIMPDFLRMFTSDPDVINLGIRYSNIVFGFSIVITLACAFEKIFQSVGQMTVSMTSMLCGCITNIILDPILIFGLGPVPALGMEGAAIATVIGQVLTLVVYLVFYFVRPIPVTISLNCLFEPPEKNSSEKTASGETDFRKKDSKRKERLSMIRRIYAIGIPATLNMALPSLMISSLNSILAVYSQSYVVVLGAYNKLQTFLYLSSNGIVQGIRPLIGYNYGAGEWKRVKNIYNLSLSLIVGMMLAGTILCQLIPGQLIGLFSSSSETVQAGAAALRIISIGFVFSAVSVTSCGALEGLGKGLPSLMISLSRYVVIIIPTAFLLSRFLGASGVWHAFWITELVSMVISFFVYRKAEQK